MNRHRTSFHSRAFSFKPFHPLAFTLALYPTIISSPENVHVKRKKKKQRTRYIIVISLKWELYVRYTWVWRVFRVDMRMCIGNVSVSGCVCDTRKNRSRCTCTTHAFRVLICRSVVYKHDLHLARARYRRDRLENPRGSPKDVGLFFVICYISAGSRYHTRIVPVAIPRLISLFSIEFRRHWRIQTLLARERVELNF